MGQCPISGGYILLARQLLESGIMLKPPEYLKAWIFLLGKANFADANNLHRGQGFTSISELMDVLSYKVGYRKVIPTKKKVWGIIDWLRGSYEGHHEGYNEGSMKVTANVPMIETTKVTHGFVYTICKYDVYQNSNNYEGNKEQTSEGNNEGLAKELRREPEGNNKYKNDKNDKKIRKKGISFSEQDMVLCKEITESWNTIVKSLPKVSQLGKSRLSAILDLYKQVGSVEEIGYGFSKVEQSDYLKGKGRQWKATFDWAIKYDNWLKVFDGNYDNGEPLKEPKPFNHSKTSKPANIGNFEQREYSQQDYAQMYESIEIKDDGKAE